MGLDRIKCAREIRHEVLKFEDIMFFSCKCLIAMSFIW